MVRAYVCICNGVVFTDAPRGKQAAQQAPNDEEMDDSDSDEEGEEQGQMRASTMVAAAIGGGACVCVLCVGERIARALFSPNDDMRSCFFELKTLYSIIQSACQQAWRP